MLINGDKRACEPCVRGHRVTSCNHRDRPLLRINRKGRPPLTCSKCNSTTCARPEEHTKYRTAAKVDVHQIYPNRPTISKHRTFREQRNTYQQNMVRTSQSSVLY
ncbi:copper fist DNA binding domain-containing protein [Aspergillus caelatus]|uniref:Copper fist DNA binding domain-containing protein n=1 Tax=Aspergillus caelatus TaxID=61420 RepID=A0A5N6ZN34_9EURO|nr:copper fist DNA binding domain-containing protein [Aspergillus caelatus]KAE8359032.1 copper fist DNA binding domain-containing protein [Aspergillus caelatus]